MAYDFKTVVDRRKSGSVKWNQMYGWKKDVAEDVIPLSVADGEYRTAPQIVEGLKKHIEEQVLGYSTAYEGYYEAVKSWLSRKHDYQIQNEWVVNTPGVVCAVLAAIRAFTEEGEGVIINRPVYYPFGNMIELAKRTEVNIPLIDNNGHYEIDFSALEEAASKKENKLLILCSPHNPTGRVWKEEELRKIAEIAVKRDLIVFSDEIWNDIVYEGYKHTIFSKVLDEVRARSIIATAPSKSFNIAGLKASNIIVEDEKLRARMNAVLEDMFVHGLNNIGYKACEIAYNEAEDWLNEMLLEIKKNLDFSKKYFAEHHPEIIVYEPEGTFLLWLDFRPLGMDHLALEKFLHEEAEFYTDEGYVFGKEGEGFERINLALPLEKLEIQYKKLTAALNKLKK